MWPFFFTTSPYDIADYADNNTPYVSGRNIEEVVASLEQKRYQRLSFNGLEIISIGNASKCQGLLSTDKQVHVNIGTAQTEYPKNEKLLGITIDSKLSFDKHI